MKRVTLQLFVALLLLGLLLASCGAIGGPTKVTIATDATWPPFEYIDEQSKEIVGYDIDLMNAIAKKAGFEIEYINVAFDPLLAGISQCQYDASISSISITDERKATMAFSDPYFRVGQQITVQASNTDITDKDSLKGKKIGAQLATTGAILSSEIEGATLITYNNIGLAFQDLLNGQVDAVITDNALAMGYVNKNPDKLKAVGDLLTGEDIGIAVCKTKTDLLQKINAALAAVKSEGLLDTLSAKWLTAQ